ncbi:hypothetical protein MKW92_017844 [Papaver armeniacum]|nr:hypothetical protein MKW92_017844 [Papaver armeniacum]
MAKAHCLSFFSPFVVGFLLVLFILLFFFGTLTGTSCMYVNGKSCWAVGSVDFGIVDPDLGDGVFVFCDYECKKIDPNYEYYETSSNEETGQRGCICCYWR